MFRKTRGQSTLEYVIILAAIVGAIIMVANSVLKPKIQSTYSGLADKMESKVEEVNF